MKLMTKHRWQLTALTATAAALVVGVASWGLGYAPMERAHAQNDPCTEETAFTDQSVENLRSRMGAEGQVVLTWRSPGLVSDADGTIDDGNAGCTWRIQEDHEGAALSNNHWCLALHYVVSRKVQNKTEYEMVSSQAHAYDSDGLLNYAAQSWVDHHPPDGLVMYRVEAVLGTERSHGAVLARQIGPVSEPEPTAAPPPDAFDVSPEAPTSVLCFYQWNGEVRSMQTPECSADELHRLWNESHSCEAVRRRQ